MRLSLGYPGRGTLMLLGEASTICRRTGDLLDAALAAFQASTVTAMRWWTTCR